MNAKEVHLLVHPFFGLLPDILSQFDPGYKWYSRKKYLRELNPKTMARFFANYWGNMLLKESNSEGSVVVIVYISDKFIENRLRIYDEQIAKLKLSENEKKELYNKIHNYLDFFGRAQVRFLDFAKKKFVNTNRLMLVEDGLPNPILFKSQYIREFKNRQIDINKTTLVYGYGEIADFCVQENVDILGSAFEINKERRIVVEDGTDLAIAYRRNTSKFMRHDIKPRQVVKQERKATRGFQRKPV